MLRMTEESCIFLYLKNGSYNNPLMSPLVRTIYFNRGGSEKQSNSQ